MKKTIISGLVFATLGLFSAIPAFAAAIVDGDLVYGTSSGITSFTPSANIDDAPPAEFNGLIPDPGNNDIVISFDFFNELLYMEISHTSGTHVAPDFTVTFTDLNFDGGESLVDIQIGYEDVGGFIEDNTLAQGLYDYQALPSSLFLDFRGLEFEDSRFMTIRLLTEDLTGTPVVPVPGAAGLGLLGLLGIGLARRFRTV